LTKTAFLPGVPLSGGNKLPYVSIINVIFIFLFLANPVYFKGTVHPKMKILSSSTHRR